MSAISRSPPARRVTFRRKIAAYRVPEPDPPAVAQMRGGGVSGRDQRGTGGDRRCASAGSEVGSLPPRDLIAPRVRLANGGGAIAWRAAMGAEDLNREEEAGGESS